MRCKNCGWENENGNTICEKCHVSLGDRVSENSSSSPISDRLRSTVAESVMFDDNISLDISTACPRCGYPLSDDSLTCPNCNQELNNGLPMKDIQKCGSCGKDIVGDAKFCPNCGNSLSKELPQRQFIQRSAMGTVLGGPASDPSSTNRFCTLKPVAWEGENVQYKPVTYSGNVIILNRSNTDPNNNTITSREQAVLTCENGEWYIENHSELRTTFIRVNGKIKLKDGDVIVLGNREFEFKG